MTKPRTMTGNGIHFPMTFEGKGGRVGKIKKWADGKYGTYFRHGEKKHRNSFASFEAAYEYLKRVFEQLDKGISPNHVLSSTAGDDLRAYQELLQVLREAVPGATLREALDYFIMHRSANPFRPQPLGACIASLVNAERMRNLSSTYVDSLQRHLRHFKDSFGEIRKIHEITPGEIAEWLAGQGWGVKTRINTKGSLVRLFIHAQKMLHAIPKGQDVAPQVVDMPREDKKAPVEIYTPAEMKKLLQAARDFFPELLPVIVVHGFLGLRPDEVHAETADREPLDWSAFNWHDSLLHVEGQKIRSKATRDVPLNAAAKSWLQPLKEQSGALWTFKRSYTKKMRDLCEKAGVPRLDNGLRHSYASYRVRQLNGDLAKLAEEMGNSPGEIVEHYKRGVTDKAAGEWFALTHAQVPALPKDLPSGLALTS